MFKVPVFKINKLIHDETLLNTVELAFRT